MENMTKEKAEVIEHMKEFIHAMADALRNFVCPLDPTEGPEEMAYIRRVMGAVDNVILTSKLYFCIIFIDSKFFRLNRHV